MNTSNQRWREWSWVSLGIAAAVWLWLLAVLPVSSGFGVGAKPLLTILRGIWSGSADLGHGPFLPLVSLYVVYSRRKAIADSMGRPDARGLVFVLLGVLLFWMGVKSEGARLCMVALAMLVWAVPLSVWGAGVARQLVFPAAFLFLCLPIDTLVVYFSMKLRLLAAAMGVGIANGIGIHTVRIGTGIHSTVGDGFNLDVAEACSGLRSIFAMIALSATYAFFTQKTLIRKWALFAFAVPVAVIGNVARIVAIVIVAAIFGEKKATGFYHDYSGYIVFVVAILLLMELGHLIAKYSLPPRVASFFHKVKIGTASQVTELSFRKRDAVLLALTPGLLMLCAVMTRMEPAVRPGNLDFLADKMPAAVGPWQGSPVWHCHNEQCMRVFTEDELAQNRVAPLTTNSTSSGSREFGTRLGDMLPRYRCPACEGGELYAVSLGEKQLLPADTRLLRVRYSKGTRNAYSVTLVVSGANRDSLHEPESCLLSQGYKAKQISIMSIEAHSAIAVKRVDLEKPSGRGGKGSRLTFVYWIFSGERNTTSRWIWKLWTAWDRAIRHEASRWVMVTVTAEQPVGLKDRPDEMLKFSGELMEQLRRGPVSTGPPSPNP
jgi:exosortase